MKQEAIEKLKSEMATSEAIPYIQIIGTYLLGYLEQHEDFASNILKDGRTVKESISAVRDVASKHKVDGVGVVSDEEGFKIIIDYFAKDVEVKTVPAPEVAQATTGVAAELFTRNAWYVNNETGEHFEYVKGVVKPAEVINKVYKTSTKKAYQEYLANSQAAVVEPMQSIETPQIAETPATEIQVAEPVEAPAPVAAWLL